VIDSSAGDITRQAQRYDVVFDIAATRSVGSLRRILAPNGLYVLVGAAKRGGWVGVFARVIAVGLRRLVLRQRVTFFVAQVKLEDLAELAKLVEVGTLRPAIDRTYPLAEGREAVRYVGTGEARAKVVITA
jgi:NADPH:quinone reductase-like Zn-dependent oxidoreductase